MLNYDALQLRINLITYMWMRSGALDARGPGFDSQSDPDGIFGIPSSPFFQTTDLKMISFICNFVMSS
jgi:hypothetical protein